LASSFIWSVAILAGSEPKPSGSKPEAARAGRVVTQRGVPCCPRQHIGGLGTE
jgi:hypothetical protein